MQKLTAFRTWWLLRAAVVAAAIAVGMASVHASALQVSPVRLQFHGAQKAHAIHVFNHGTQGLDAQVRVMRWTQVGGVDQLEPAADMVASPAIVRVAPGKQQLVRLIRGSSAPQDREQSYRVLVDELPNPAPEQAAVGVQVLLRYSIPVFVEAAQAPGTPGAAHPPKQSPLGKCSSPSHATASATDATQLHAQWVPQGEGKGVLQVRNDGPRAVRISQLQVTQPDGTQWPVNGGGLLGYVLAGQQMRWPLDVGQSWSSDWKFEARLNDDKDVRPLPMGQQER